MDISHEVVIEDIFSANDVFPCKVSIKLILTDYQLTGRICRKRGDIFNIKAIPEVGTMAFDLAPTKE